MLKNIIYVFLFICLNLFVFQGYAAGISSYNDNGISPDKTKNFDDTNRKAAPGDNTFNTDAPRGQNFETNVPPQPKPNPDRY